MKSKLLYLYPFVHVNSKDKVLFYNTLNGKFLVTNKTVVKDLFYKLINNQNKVLVLEPNLLSNPVISEFLSEIVTLNMGNIIEYSPTKKLPIQLINELKIQKEIEFLDRRDERSVGEDILNYLNEVVIYLNSDCSLSCKSCAYSHKQVTSCKTGSAKKEIDLNLFKRFISVLDSIPIETLHISGGDIFKYNNLKNLFPLLRERAFSAIFHVNAQNFVNNYEQVKSSDFENNILNVYINNYNNLDFNNLFNILNNNFQNFQVTFLVESEEQINIVENVSRSLDQSKIEVKAIYNEHNIKFFEENVFINEELLFEENHNLHSITQKQGLNPNFFGSLILDNDGEMYSNSGCKSLGNLNSTSIQEAIYKELKNNERWRLLRQKVEPCSNCYYNLLCPSISNYEIEIGKFDLCNIKR